MAVGGLWWAEVVVLLPSDQIRLCSHLCVAEVTAFLGKLRGAESGVCVGGNMGVCLRAVWRSEDG